MQLQILLEVYFCTDAVFDLVQFVTFWYGISSSIVCKFFSWCPTFRSTLVFSKSAIVENPSFQPDLQAMPSTVHKLWLFFQHFKIVHFLFSCIVHTQYWKITKKVSLEFIVIFWHMTYLMLNETFLWISTTVRMWINDNMSGGMKRPFWMLKRTNDNYRNAE